MLEVKYDDERKQVIVTSGGNCLDLLAEVGGVISAVYDSMSRVDKRAAQAYKNGIQHLVADSSRLWGLNLTVANKDEKIDVFIEDVN